jgi:hypothetical protein
MPWRFGYFPDESEEEAAKANCLTYEQAKIISGYHFRKLRNMVDSGVLRTTTHRGKRGICRRSLADYVEREGYGPSVQEAAAELRSQGRDFEAMALLERAQAAANAEQGVYPQEEVTRTVEALPDPGDQFLRKFGRGD